MGNIEKELDDEESKLLKESEELHRKYDIDYSSAESFVGSVVNALLDYLDEETLNFVKDTPVLWLHMSLGMWIRNVFIWGYMNELDSFRIHPDDLSVVWEALV